MDTHFDTSYYTDYYQGEWYKSRVVNKIFWTRNHLVTRISHQKLKPYSYIPFVNQSQKPATNIDASVKYHIFMIGKVH